MCLLSPLRLKTIFLVSGLDIENQQNDFHDVPLLIYVISFSFFFLGQRQSLPLKTKNPWWIRTTKLNYFCCCASWLLKEKCWVCIFQVAEMRAKCRGLCWSRALHGGVWASKWCKNYSNIAFHLGDTVTWPHVLNLQSPVYCTIHDHPHRRGG